MLAGAPSTVASRVSNTLGAVALRAAVCVARGCRASPDVRRIIETGLDRYDDSTTVQLEEDGLAILSHPPSEP
jgi:hypothetical protein